MTRFRVLLAAAVMIPLAGCKWINDLTTRERDRPHDGPLEPVRAEKLVAYVNGQATQLQSLSYDSVRLVATDHGVRLPANLTGSLVAAQPRNFRMSVSALAAKVDLGSNEQKFWVYFDGAGTKPMYVYASHTDFQEGKARLPGGIPFEPEWVMQALGMTVLPPNNQYEVPPPDQKNRTYTLRWPSTLPNGTAVVKEIVFDGDTATQNRPQIQKHLVRDQKGKLICSAEIKQAKTVSLGQGDPRAGGNQPVVHYPTLVVLKWTEQDFEMKLDLGRAEVNKPFTPEETRQWFTPRNYSVPAIDLARHDEFPRK